MGTIAEKLQYTSDAVDDIQAAIQEKGVTVADTDALDTYGDKIRSIESGGTDTSDATLTDGKYLASGQTAYGKDGKVEGTMTIHEGVSANKNVNKYTTSSSPIVFSGSSSNSDTYFDGSAIIGFPEGGYVRDSSGTFGASSILKTHPELNVSMSHLVSEIGLTEKPDFISYGKSLFGIDGTGHQGKINYYTKTCAFSDGTWSGPAFTSGTWTSLASSDDSSSWGYKHNLNLDITKVKILCATFRESNYGFRLTRGYAKSSTTLQYHYLTEITVGGSDGYLSKTVGNQTYYDQYKTKELAIDNYNYQSSNNNTTWGFVYAYVTNNYFYFNFWNYGRTLQFYNAPEIVITIGYED